MSSNTTTQVISSVEAPVAPNVEEKSAAPAVDTTEIKETPTVADKALEREAIANSRLHKLVSEEHLNKMRSILLEYNSSVLTNEDSNKYIVGLKKQNEVMLLALEEEKMALKALIRDQTAENLVVNGEIKEGCSLLFLKYRKHITKCSGQIDYLNRNIKENGEKIDKESEADMARQSKPISPIYKGLTAKMTEAERYDKLFGNTLFEQACEELSDDAKSYIRLLLARARNMFIVNDNMMVNTKIQSINVFQNFYMFLKVMEGLYDRDNDEVNINMIDRDDAQEIINENPKPECSVLRIGKLMENNHILTWTAWTLHLKKMTYIHVKVFVNVAKKYPFFVGDGQSEKHTHILGLINFQNNKHYKQDTFVHCKSKHTA